MKDNEKLELALKYYDKLGWSIFPLAPRRKLPLNGIKWKQLQQERPTREQIIFSIDDCSFAHFLSTPSLFHET